MADLDKNEAVQVDEIDSQNSNSPTPAPHHHTAIEIDQGNEAVLLRIDDAGAEKGQVGSLRLAKDGHVCLSWPRSSHRCKLICASDRAYSSTFG
jgi:hypothetical protein